MDARRVLLDQLTCHGLLLPSGVPGVYGRSGAFESIVEHLERYITAQGEDEAAEVWRFPPVLPRQHYQRTEHLKSFPHLLGSLHSFTGGDAEHLALLQRADQGGDWSAWLGPTEVVDRKSVV